MVGAPGRSVTSPVMVGRQAESDRLDTSLASLSEGRARLVVISGEAGAGKTRLIDESLARVESTTRVLRGACLALASRIPYLPIAEILRDLVRQVPAHTLSNLIGPARSELARVLPELASAIGVDEDAASPRTRRSDELERLRLYEAILAVAERIAAEQPTVFVIEDVQWIDPASLELLSFLAHGLNRSPAALVVSVRPEDAEDRPAVLTLIAELGRGGAADRIELGPLPPDATRRLVSEILGTPPSDDLSERIQHLSDGNPLFAEELLAASLDGGRDEELPARLRDLFAVRLASVADDVLEILRVAAAAGRTLDDRLLASASGLSEEQVQHAVRAAVEEHILVKAPGPVRPGYRFRHEALRALVATQLLPAQERQIHAAYARALAGSPAEHGHASEIANHWDAAGETEHALAAHVTAGEVTLHSFAYEQARDHYERALQRWDQVEDAATLTSTSRVDVVAHAAGAAAKTGAFDRAIELTRVLIQDLGRIDTEVYELARSSLRWYLWESGDIEAARMEAEAVVADAADMPERWRANALAHLAGLLLYEQRTADAQQRAAQALDAATEADAVEEQIMAEGVLGWCLLLEGDVDAGLAAIRRALDAASATEERGLQGRYPVGTVLAHAHLTGALELVGRFEEAYEVAAEGVGIAARQGVARTFGSMLRASAARALYQLGRWTEARDWVNEGLTTGAVGSGRIALMAVRAQLALSRGDLEEAQRTIVVAEDMTHSSTPLDVRRWLTAAAAEHAIWQGDSMGALTKMSLLADDPEPDSDVTPGARPALLDASIPVLLALGARACADLALRDRASGEGNGLSTIAVEQLDAWLRRVRRRKTLASAWAGDLAIAKAELERAGGGTPGSVRLWQAAVERSAGRPYASCYSRWRLAEAYLARRNGREAAATVIEQALAVVDSLGATPIGDELLALARRARLSVASEAQGPVVSVSEDQRPFGLTTREVEVLALLAGGLSNQEIGEQLYISPKTASVHVSNIYGKLGVESRVAAATTAHELGLIGPVPDTNEDADGRRS